MIKDRPHRLDLIYINQPLYFVTFAARDRRSIPSLAHAQFASATGTRIARHLQIFQLNGVAIFSPYADAKVHFASLGYGPPNFGRFHFCLFRFVCRQSNATRGRPQSCFANFHSGTKALTDSVTSWSH
jgi:hypothetical protein